MATLLSKALAVLQLFFLVQCSIVIVLAMETRITNPSAQPISTQKPVVVQGSVYCKACNQRGNDTLDGATPLEGAVVRVNCKNNQNLLIQEVKTNQNGYFFIRHPKQLSMDQFQECKVFLVSSPKDSCNIPTDLNAGLIGSTLTLNHKITTRIQLKFDLFSIKPFAFEASSEEACDQNGMEIDEVICNPDCVLINYGCYC